MSEMLASGSVQLYDCRTTHGETEGCVGKLVHGWCEPSKDRLGGAQGIEGLCGPHWQGPGWLPWDATALRCQLK